MGKIEVFFISGHRARFDSDVSIVDKQLPTENIGRTVNLTGKPVINWRSVACIRKVKEDNEDDE